MNVRPPASGFRGLCRAALAVSILSLPLLAALRAQNPSSPAADEDWRALQAALTPSGTPTGGPATPAQREAGRLAHADRLARAAQHARDFHLRHPDHPQAALARKLEVTSLLESVRLGRTALESAAIDRARAFRHDPTHQREHRFEVALAADRLAFQRRLGPAAVRERPVEHEQLAHALYREFGPIPEVFGLYAGLVASVDTESANRLATRILELRPPPFARHAAENITARYGLIGRPLSLRLTTLAGQRMELPATPAVDAPTVLYVWTPTAAASGPFAALRPLKGKLPANVRWIYLGLGATTAQAGAATARTPFAGVHCVEADGLAGVTARRLKADRTTRVFVLNRQGVLIGFGRPDELPALLAAATR
jgi:hypothetical protein